ncbi:short-chain dehydrogenase [Sphingobium jiangsuense]|uniref:NAD(P)-dependent dehydrogenase (Short-subunit alcohol dehydrogenase family) n=1 Tax=Sphingobium jiangsuense TaxID=870476 RepID=A0A7W6BGZ2_9SPHN|nr:SDR family NAD(P)-dependent oxidoreductase [Sphingobium jiangsuense]MBB3925864.1 NAD(P)-dependent dehydrogenase (short-subunit alcohol dehydrogenase family) [Sphingobium jiangsuense]GLS98711.1 short-chain dehydrogenase [Sphingobium jiangsuense]
MTDIGFDGRVAIVTGAGNGLGRDYALELARRGARVVVNDLGGSGSGQGASHSAADLVVQQIRDEGGEAVASHDSVSTRAGGESIVQTALDAFGKVDICINNAGFLRNNRFEDLSDGEIDAIIDVHLKGAFYVAQPAYRAMRRNGYGRFLFTGSASAMFGHAWQANYAAAKGGLMGLSHVVAIEGSAYGITSNLLMPTAQSRLADEMNDGFMEIPAFAQAVAGADYAASADRVTVPFNTPLAVYLVSERCTATHGIYSANSGRYARVRICAADGWVAPMGPTPPSVEDIAAHFDRIGDMSHYHEPMTVYDEFTAVAQAARRQQVI